MERKDLKMSRIPLRIQNFGDLPNEALISAKEICLLSGRSRSSLWRDVKKSRLPKPISIGSNSVRWPAIKSCLENKSASVTPNFYPETPRRRAELSDLLNYISSDCSYERYRGVVWAILGTGWPDAEILAKSWCLKAPDRYNENDFFSICIIGSVTKDFRRSIAFFCPLKIASSIQTTKFLSSAPLKPPITCSTSATKKHLITGSPLNSRQLRGLLLL